MTPETDNLRRAWQARPNTQETPSADYFLRYGRIMHRLCKIISHVELPEEPDLPPDRPLIFAANHRSFLDIAAALAVFGNLSLSSRMQVRADMFDKPLVGGWLQRLGAIPTATAVREQAEAEAVQTLLSGSTVAIMPEGRLVRAQDRPSGVGQARTGVARIAAQSHALVVPVAIYGSDEIWPTGRPIPKLGLFRRRPLIVELGDPIDFDFGDHQANADRLMNQIASMLTNMDERFGS